VSGLKRYLVLIVFVVLTLVGLVIRYTLQEESILWKFWSAIDVSFAVSLGVLAFMGYKEYIKSEDEIKMFFKVKNRKIDTNLSLLRRDCTRGEILGILGMMQRKTDKRFLFDNKELQKLLKNVQDVQRGNKDQIVIEMTKDELEQFIIEDKGEKMRTKRRVVWGFNPITRVVRSKKVYNRKKEKQNLKKYREDI